MKNLLSIISPFKNLFSKGFISLLVLISLCFLSLHAQVDKVEYKHLDNGDLVECSLNNVNDHGTLFVISVYQEKSEQNVVPILRFEVIDLHNIGKLEPYHKKAQEASSTLFENIKIELSNGEILTSDKCGYRVTALIDNFYIGFLNIKSNKKAHNTSSEYVKYIVNSLSSFDIKSVEVFGLKYSLSSYKTAKIFKEEFDVLANKTKKTWFMRTNQASSASTGSSMSANTHSNTPEINRTPTTEVKTFTVNGVSFRVVYFPNGSFLMGGGKDPITLPAHNTHVMMGYMGETEVTQELWKAVMGTTIIDQWRKSGLSGASYDTGATMPMTYVSWEDCRTFCKRLNQLLSNQLGDMYFRLPTEAEWEFVAKGANLTHNFLYSGSNQAQDVSNTQRICNVKNSKANELGIFDMSGNVWEWCHDYYNTYPSTEQFMPVGPSTGKNGRRVLRGGSSNGGSNFADLEVKSRGFGDPSERVRNEGFRIMLSRHKQDGLYSTYGY